MNIPSSTGDWIVIVFAALIFLLIILAHLATDVTREKIGVHYSFVSRPALPPAVDSFQVQAKSSPSWAGHCLPVFLHSES